MSFLLSAPFKSSTVQRFNGLGAGGGVLTVMIRHQYIGANHVVISLRGRSFSTPAFLASFTKRRERARYRSKFSL